MEMGADKATLTKNNKKLRSLQKARERTIADFKAIDIQIFETQQCDCILKTNQRWANEINKM
jgi:hypothetical protein